MPLLRMAKNYRRSSRVSKRTRYSVENTGVRVSVGANVVNGIKQAGQVIVPPTDIQGVRTVRHLTISLSSILSDSTEFWYALVYVPEGYQPNALFPDQSHSGLQGTLYEPNQNVLSCGYIDPSAGPIRIRSNVAKNLNSGDHIDLVVGHSDGSDNVILEGLISYAVAYK